MLIYIAGKVTARGRLKGLRERVRALGHACASSWIDRAQDYPVPSEVAREEGLRDLEEINEAEALVLDTLDESNTGGREFEAGFAAAQGLKIWRVGPVRHIFHELVDEAFEDWDQLLKVFRAQL